MCAPAYEPTTRVPRTPLVANVHSRQNQLEDAQAEVPLKKINKQILYFYK